MKTMSALLLLSLAGCAGLPTPPRIPVDPNLAQVGLQLMQMGQPYTLPAQQSAQPTQTNCVVYPPNKVTGQQQVVCR